MRRVALVAIPTFCLLSVVLGLAGDAAGKPRKARPPRAVGEPTPTHRVVGGPTELFAARGEKPTAELQPGTPLRWLRPDGLDHVHVETLGSVRLQGVMRRVAIGLRVIAPTEIRPETGGRPIRLLPGADVRFISARGRDALVETVGVVVKGVIPRTALGAAGPEFVYPEPGALVQRVVRAVELAAPEEPDLALARIVTGEDVVVLDGGNPARVRAYGPVLLEGLVPRAALGDRERKQVGLAPSGPANHEVTIDADLFTVPGGKLLGRVRGGTPAVLEEAQGQMARIVTAGDVRTRGWIQSRALTRLASIEELLR